jgi:uncharacterized protein YPO0396
MAKKGKTKIKFLKDYAPRKKGEVKELDTKLAEFYLNNGIAELAVNESETEDKSGCADCEKSAQVAADLATANESLKAANESLATKTQELEEANGKVTELEGKLKTSEESLVTANESLKTANAALKKRKLS